MKTALSSKKFRSIRLLVGGVVLVVLLLVLLAQLGVDVNPMNALAKRSETICTAVGREWVPICVSSACEEVDGSIECPFYQTPDCGPLSYETCTIE